MKITKNYRIAMGATLALLGAGMVQAGTITPCPAFNETGGANVDISNRLSANVGCEISSETKDKLGNDPTQYTVNKEAFFGFDDWMYAGKDEFNDFETGIVDVGYNIAGNSWNLGDGSWDVYSDIMLIFKSGNNELVGYLLKPGELTGTWSTPFTSGPFDLPGQSQSQDVSHITAYVRGQATAIPEPGALALLGLGLAGLAATRFRRNGTSAAQ